MLKIAIFPAQFFLLLGIDFFLAGSIATIIFEERFPKAIPYILIIGSFVGFSQLLIGPEYLDEMGDAIQFYYCVCFALIALASLIGLNLYLFLGQPDPTKKSVMVESVLFGTALPVPATASLLFFASAYVNDRVIALPYLPVLPIAIVYIAVVGSMVIFCAVLVITYLDKVKIIKLSLRRRSKQKTGGSPSAAEEEDQEGEEMGKCPVCGAVSPLSASRCSACGSEFVEWAEQES